MGTQSESKGQMEEIKWLIAGDGGREKDRWKVEWKQSKKQTKRDIDVKRRSEKQTELDR